MPARLSMSLRARGRPPPAENSERARARAEPEPCRARRSRSLRSRARAASLSREQLSIKTKKRDERSPLPLAGRPVSRGAPNARQFSFEPCLLRSSEVNSRAKFTAAKGFSLSRSSRTLPSYYVSARERRPVSAYRRAAPRPVCRVG